jgi:hypothetical protein
MADKKEEGEMDLWREMSLMRPNRSLRIRLRLAARARVIAFPSCGFSN